MKRLKYDFDHKVCSAMSVTSMEEMDWVQTVLQDINVAPDKYPTSGTWVINETGMTEVKTPPAEFIPFIEGADTMRRMGVEFVFYQYNKLIVYIEPEKMDGIAPKDQWTPTGSGLLKYRTPQIEFMVRQNDVAEVHDVFMGP